MFKAAVPGALTEAGVKEVVVFAGTPLMPSDTLPLKLFWEPMFTV